MTWRPLKSIPDPIQTAFCDAVRATIMPFDTHAGISRVENGMFAVDMTDGKRIHVRFDTTSQAAVKFGERDAIHYGLEGNALVDREALGLAAEAIADVKTKAFLHVACAVRWRGNAK